MVFLFEFIDTQNTHRHSHKDTRARRHIAQGDTQTDTYTRTDTPLHRVTHKTILTDAHYTHTAIHRETDGQTDRQQHAHTAAHKFTQTGRHTYKYTDTHLTIL